MTKRTPIRIRSPRRFTSGKGDAKGASDFIRDIGRRIWQREISNDVTGFLGQNGDCIGHAKSVDSPSHRPRVRGHLNLRMDDTNPRRKSRNVDSIQERRELADGGWADQV